ncbi:c-type cytochrome [Chitinophaga sp. YIM B06452]|uniref:c-type cytochrome n=1 Tax=Chitinophaga sp. YIM B06452 TaxID=3082158 RepID=UPI0031FEB05E
MNRQKILLPGISLVIVLLLTCKRNKQVPEILWAAPDTSTIPHTAEGTLIRYGRDLIANTAQYLGPGGAVGTVSNGMNCQNCHLSAGTIPWGNNYGAAFSTYPKFRERSGTIESLEKKINDCLERSLNGEPIDSNSREMQAMVAYMRWLGKGLRKGTRPPGSGIKELPFLDRAADTVKGALVYTKKCMQCHGLNGEGKKKTDTAGYHYPPLWGDGSFNTGAGIYRLTKMAGYIRHNMPQGTNYSNPQLTDAEAWDVAAFIITQPRPEKKFPGDWPVIYTKPIDHPFGPFADTFPALQHKYGPFAPIKAMHKQKH